MSLISELWYKNHIGKKALDLKKGFLDRNSWRYHSYKNINPNLVLLGAQKSGTSSIAHYLSVHPDIHVSCPHKEPGFYLYDEWAKGYWNKKGRNYKTREDLLRRGMLDGYSGQKYLLDATTRYSIGALSRKHNVAEKLDKSNAKCIYIVRNPFQRMISAYAHLYKTSGRDFNEQIAYDTSMLSTSLYGYQLDSYSNLIAKENILILIFEEVFRDIEKTLAQIYRFLDIGEKGLLKEYPVINKNKQSDRYYYSRENYFNMIGTIKSDMRRLERYLGRGVEWDVSYERWVKD